MLSKKLFSVLAILFGMTVSFGAYAQKIAVRGTVSDASGPVIGAVVLVEMGQFFREWLVGEGFFAKNGVPEAGTVRFYANSIQRTRATARAFAAGMFPMADIDVEQHTPLGTMDPVFNPQITRVSEGFLAKAYAEIDAMGGPDGPLKAKYAFLEKVLDIKSSPAARHDTTAFGAFPSAVRFEVGKKPIMTGGLKMACSASDALTGSAFRTGNRESCPSGSSMDTGGASVSSRRRSVKTWTHPFGRPATARVSPQPYLASESAASFHLSPELHKFRPNMSMEYRFLHRRIPRSFHLP